MITSNFTIKDWSVKLFINNNNNINPEKILEVLYDIKCNYKCALKAYKTITSTKTNEGFTYGNSFLKKSVIFIGIQDSDVHLINTIAHESRHLQQYIANDRNLDPNGEEVCYILGDISSKIYSIYKDNNLI